MRTLHICPICGVPVRRITAHQLRVHVRAVLMSDGHVVIREER